MKFRRLVFGLARSSVRSDTGVEIRVTIPYVTYSEGHYVLRVGKELAFRAVDRGRKKKAYWLIGLRAPMQWEAPYGHEQITSEQRAEIEKTVKAALEYLKIDYEVY